MNFSNRHKHSLRIMHCALYIAFAALAANAVPEVTSCTMAQGPDSRLVTVEYTLSEAPAVVTLDIETNYFEYAAEKWASIGGEHIWNAEGAVWRKVTAADLQNGRYVITWHPEQSWKDPETGNGFTVNGTTRKARAKVTAWALDNTPDYMVVNILAAGAANTPEARCTYYPAVDFLPGSELGQKGAITNNADYKTSKLVMRKIMAKGVEWTTGSSSLELGNQAADNEAPYLASLTNNYYIGVFEITQSQWQIVGSTFFGKAPYFTNAVDRAFRPMEGVGYMRIRMSFDEWNQTGTKEWPGEPYPTSFLGKLRARTGIDFDLPSLAQWEFACRAGNGSTKWGDGSTIVGTTSDGNLDGLARYAQNGGMIDGSVRPGRNSDASLGTAVVGSYRPNDWGLYDMHGNVSEWVLDWWSENYADYPLLHGMVCTNGYNATPQSQYVSRRFIKGGSFKHNAQRLRPAARETNEAYISNYYSENDAFWLGFRIACQAGLK